MYASSLQIWGRGMTVLDTEFVRSQFTRQPPPILPRGHILSLQQYKGSQGTSLHNPNKVPETNLIADPEVESQGSRSQGRKTH